MTLAEQYLYDLGMLLARGEEHLAEYVQPSALSAVRNALAVHTDSDVVLHPDFGQYAQLSIDGELLDETRPLTVQLEFENRSRRETSAGVALATPRRRVRVSLVLDSSLRSVVDQRFEATS